MKRGPGFLLLLVAVLSTARQALGATHDDDVIATPVVAVVFPVQGSTLFLGDLGPGFSVGGSLGWANQNVPLDLAIGGAYSAFTSGSLHTPATTDTSLVRRSTPHIVDVSVTARYWYKRLFFDAGAELSMLSVVRIRDMLPRGANPSGLPDPFHEADTPFQTGPGLSLGVGVAAIPLHGEFHDRFSPAIFIAIDPAVRFFDRGTLWTVPLTIGVRF